MIKVSITLDAPLAHGSFDNGDSGNTTLLRRIPVLIDGQQVPIPAVSGNALRGNLRRKVFRDLLGVCGITSETLPSGEWDSLYAALCNGGHLDSSEQAMKPDQIRVLRAAVPALSVFGAALRSWMLPGRCSVGICWPVCRETVRAGLVDGESDVLAEDLVHEVGTVRHVDRTEQDPALSGVTPMPVLTETLVTGTRLSSRIRFEPEATVEERSAVAFGLSMVTRLSGKTAGGFGVLRVEHDGAPERYLEWRGGSGVPAAADALRSLAEKMGAGRRMKGKRGAA